MQYTVVSTSEWTYPDRREYPSGSQSVRLVTARNSYASAQILLLDCAGPMELCPTLSLSDFHPEWYELRSIPVEANCHRIFEGELGPGDFPAEEHFPERRAPFRVYDCCRPLKGSCLPQDGTIALYFAIPIPSDAVPGTYNAALTVAGIEIPLALEVTSAIVPSETLVSVYWYSKEKIAQCHGLEMDTPAFEEMEEKYLRLMRRMRQNMLQLDMPKVQKTGDLSWSFDYSQVERQAKRALALGFTDLSFSPMRKLCRRPCSFKKARREVKN